ncbi:unnamed protein product [Effrenium voratum]|nr:unnamed protein product [Effrenium voratum]|mmetsp:Transcript_51173/g.122575  ORF Transcript_51173/g.122575 Transcript_51173/m.122575 type:complete len:304 (-) Transcript_51173:77-988(-)
MPALVRTPSPVRRGAGVAEPLTPSQERSSLQPSSPPPGLGSPGLLDRIYERKRAALVDLNGTALNASRRRLREADPEEQPEEKVAVQRFTLVSRGAPPAKRGKFEHQLLRVPPRASAQLGPEVHICRCSDCDKHGVRRRLSGRRTCRRDTESHPEYALLLNLTDRFEAECAREGEGLVHEVCCREKSAYFILGPGSTTVGYVAAEVAANRKVARRVQDPSGHDDDDKVPVVTQIYVEPEFRNQTYATQALQLLLREHSEVRVDAPSDAVCHILERLGFCRAGCKEGPEGRPIVSFAHKGIDVC